jgi:hypothetical protein
MAGTSEQIDRALADPDHGDDLNEVLAAVETVSSRFCESCDP